MKYSRHIKHEPIPTPYKDRNIRQFGRVVSHLQTVNVGQSAQVHESQIGDAVYIHLGQITSFEGGGHDRILAGIEVVA